MITATAHISPMNDLLAQNMADGFGDGYQGRMQASTNEAYLAAYRRGVRKAGR